MNYIASLRQCVYCIHKTLSIVRKTTQISAPNQMHPIGPYGLFLCSTNCNLHNFTRNYAIYMQKHLVSHSIDAQTVYIVCIFYANLFCLFYFYTVFNSIEHLFQMISEWYNDSCMVFLWCFDKYAWNRNIYQLLSHLRLSRDKMSIFD